MTLLTAIAGLLGSIVDSAGHFGSVDKRQDHSSPATDMPANVSNDEALLSPAEAVERGMFAGSLKGALGGLVTGKIICSIGHELSQTGAVTMRRNLNVQPTIYRFTVRINGDILFDDRSGTTRAEFIV